jgi:hypothetical protein
MGRMLADHEATGLKHWLSLMMDADEPGAMLAAFKRIAEIKTLSFMRGEITPAKREAAGRWVKLAEALEDTQLLIAKAKREKAQEKDCTPLDVSSDAPI